VYKGKGYKYIDSVAGQIIELDASKIYVYRVQTVLRCYVIFMQNIMK